MQPKNAPTQRGPFGAHMHHALARADPARLQHLRDAPGEAIQIGIGPGLVGAFPRQRQRGARAILRRDRADQVGQRVHSVVVSFRAIARPSPRVGGAMLYIY